MEIIAHRVNTLRALESLDPSWGAEIDVRYHEDNIVLAHDPFGHHKEPILTLDKFLKHFNGYGRLILNVKTEGIERHLIEKMRLYSVTRWFFLDLSMPYFVRFAHHAKMNDIDGFATQNLAVRFSEFEPIEYAACFSGMAGWIWADCFSKYSLTSDNCKRLSAMGFKTCLVSPELQGHDVTRIPEFRKSLNGCTISAVCTKRPDLWT